MHSPNVRNSRQIIHTGNEGGARTGVSSRPKCSSRKHSKTTRISQVLLVARLTVLASHTTKCEFILRNFKVPRRINHCTAPRKYPDDIEALPVFRAAHARNVRLIGESSRG
jgi:hypothetical protein